MCRSDPRLQDEDLGLLRCQMDHILWRMFSMIQNVMTRQCSYLLPAPVRLPLVVLVLPRVSFPATAELPDDPKCDPCPVNPEEVCEVPVVPVVPDVGWEDDVTSPSCAPDRWLPCPVNPLPVVFEVVFVVFPVDWSL